MHGGTCIPICKAGFVQSQPVTRCSNGKLQHAVCYNPETEVCSDSCASSSNGYCEDGRPGSAYEYHKCRLGTDCSDCGPISNAHMFCPVEAPRGGTSSVRARSV